MVVLIKYTIKILTMGSVESKKSLSPKDLEFLRGETDYDEKTIIEWYTDFEHNFKDGKLTQTKIVEICKTFFPKGNADKFASHIFRTFDKDKNGFVDFKEFLFTADVKVKVAKMSGAANAFYQAVYYSIEAIFIALFRLYDVNGNGLLELGEMTKVLGDVYDVMGVGATKPTYSANVRAKKIFNKIDKNRDGHVTEAEFIMACLKDYELLEMLMPKSKQ